MSAQNPRPIGVLGAFLGLIGFSALAGILVTAMVAPAIAVTSTTAKDTVAIFDDLPEYLEFGQLNQRNTLWATQGGQPVPFATVYDQNRQEVPWDSVSQFVKDAAIAGEDRRFYEHGGVDLAGIARAAVTNATSDSTQGASTITQQLVKNLLIVEASRIADEAERDVAVDAAQETTLQRKLREAKLAIGLEKDHTKQEILLGYLNIAGFGGNTYGIQAASQLYFSVNAVDLTLPQAASLLAIVQNPESFRLDVPENREGAQIRRNFILGNMLDEGMIDQAQHDEAAATPLDDTTIIQSSPQQGCQYAAAAQHFCDYVLRNIKNLASLGATEEERLENWKVGGYNVYTTIDLDQQAAAEATLAKYTPADEARFELGSAFSTIQAGTGQIRVMAQNKGYDARQDSGDPTKSSVNFNTDFEYGGSTGFQPGSAYKLFTLVNWLQSGHGLNESVNGAGPRNISIPLGDCTPTEFTAGPERNAKFVNDSGGRGGRMSVMTATAQSTNNAFADMASKLSVCDIRDTAYSMGVHRADGRELKLNSTMVLGTDEVAPMTMANAYATVAANGVLCQPIAVDRIVAADGTELGGQPQDCAQAIEPNVAAAAATALQGVMRGGTGARANPNDGTQLIGKTGTADALSTFLAASSTKLASAVWVGNIVGQQNLRRITIAGTNGGQIRFGVMREMLRSLDASPYNEGAGPFPKANSALTNGRTQPVPNVTGQTPDQARGVIDSLGLNFEVGDTVSSEIAAGSIVATDPPAGTPVSRGTTIRAQISDGSLAATMPDVIGQNVKDATGAIAAAGLDPGKIQYTYQQSLPNERCRVAASNPAGGAATSKAAAVTLTVNAGVLNNPGDNPNCG